MKNTANDQQMYLGKIAREINQVVKEHGVSASVVPAEIIKAAIMTGGVEQVKTYLDGGTVFYKDLDAIARTIQYLDGDSEEFANLFDGYFIGVIEEEDDYYEKAYAIIGKGDVSWANIRLCQIVDEKFKDAAYVDGHLKVVDEEEYKMFLCLKQLKDADHALSLCYSYSDKEDSKQAEYSDMIDKLATHRHELEAQLDLEDSCRIF